MLFWVSQRMLVFVPIWAELELPKPGIVASLRFVIYNQTPTQIQITPLFWGR